LPSLIGHLADRDTVIGLQSLFVTNQAILAICSSLEEGLFLVTDWGDIFFMDVSTSLIEIGAQLLQGGKDSGLGKLPTNFW